MTLKVSGNKQRVFAQLKEFWNREALFSVLPGVCKDFLQECGLKAKKVWGVSFSFHGLLLGASPTEFSDSLLE